MKRILITGLLVLLYCAAIHAQAVYVDSNSGNDQNAGTLDSPVSTIQKAAAIIASPDNDKYVIKINPGVYILDKHVSISTEKNMTEKRIIIEAVILPDDSSWTPEKMPVIASTAKRGELPEFDSFVAAFLINASHVTIRGLKFPGNFYPNTRYFPIARFNKAITDLTVEQCLFVGDRNASPIQVGLLAHGNQLKVDHCVFYNAKNGVVYWQDAGDGAKSGNSMTNCIIYGAYQTAIWTAWPDKDFVFKNNIVTNCKHAWTKNSLNTTQYSLDNSLIVNNSYYQGVSYNDGVKPEEFAVNENNITKTGEISLRLVEDVDAPIPIDYLHIVPNTPGYDYGAGLFKHQVIK